MTDEQLTKIKKAFTDIGYAIADIGDALGMYADPEPDEDPVDPPVDPPPPVESEFMRKVVLRDDTPRRYLPGQYEAFDVPSTVGMSWGLSAKLFQHGPPTGTSPISVWDDAAPQWQLKVPGPTRLAVAFALTGGGYGGFDVVVDDLTGRWVHVVVGYDFELKIARLWIDGVQRSSTAFLGSIGYPETTPPLIVNSTAAGHAAGDISIDELVYAVGAAPTQADVDLLLGIPAKPDGITNGVTDGIAWTEVNGPESVKDWTDPKSFLDGKFLFGGKQVVNNPPRQKRWEFPIPQDVGREVQ
jgi:hypothetical protein